jgi:GNAT superfamily N-acetyltransferase
MPPGAGRIHERIDRAWLAAEAQREPVLHAYAVWDLERAPASTRFISWEGPGPHRSYLLVWLGDPTAPVVHWIGDEPQDLALLDAFPTDASSAVVPERAMDDLRRRLVVANAEPLLILHRPTGLALPPVGRAPAVRLGPERAEELRVFAERYPEMLTRPYRTIDLETEKVWGSFEGTDLVGVARVTVALPRIWIVSGVFVAPHARRSRHGRALTIAATAEAQRTRADAGLFVRERNEPAVSLYRSLGYRPVARRFWVEFARPGLPRTTSGAGG